MDVHWAQVKQISLADSRPPRALLKVLGYAALFVSLLLCLVVDRPSIAALVWIMLMAGADFSVAWTLSKFPRTLNWCWPGRT